jgi:hypothetical protein
MVTEELAAVDPAAEAAWLVRRNSKFAAAAPAGTRLPSAPPPSWPLNPLRRPSRAG